jgi:uncharacterized membrane protein
MLQFPPMQAWDSLHPLIVHFPIVLLMISPLFIFIGTALPPLRGRPYLIAALILLLLGTASLFLAAQTGQAASRLADRSPLVATLIESHQALADETTDVFVTLSIIGFSLFFLPRFLGMTESPLFSRVLPLSFLVFYSVGVIFLVNTADRGGRLVHEFGVHANIPPTTEKPAAPLENPTPE